ncbi:hypothetical protein [Cytobacillus purgationiresistens]|uniref:AI-2E family transporter n=1 Tax=Cytobacillus purgationiresistens TaxID=863449 RepID=A0ABU0API0_9BACI|nr:hypothetical protein [Cytobacillus purgationiresistens]MDQ0273167.1 hypothetical protein [Cytobacillus purgationiresistens]
MEEQQQQKFTLKRHFIGFSLVIAIIIIRYINVHIYNMPIILGAIATGVITFISIKLLNLLPIANRSISKKTDGILILIMVALIFIIFYQLNL